MKKVKNYFPHDFGARNDKKLEKVRYKVGIAGIGLYWCIIECLYENNGYLSLDDDVDLLSYQLRVDKESIIDLIENYDLFKKNKNNFYSPSVLERLQEILNKSEQNKKNILKRWEKARALSSNESNTNVLPSNNESNTNEQETNYYIKENKKKENKINNNYYNLSTTTTDTIYTFIETNFNRTLSSIEIDKISSWLLEYKEDIIKYAIEIAVMNQKKIFSYVEGILKNWKGKGLDTIDKIKEDNLTGQKISNSKRQEETTVDIPPEIFKCDWLNEDWE